MQVNEWCRAEAAIAAAVDEVEAMAADVRLTEAVVLLGRAKDRVADFVDGVRESPHLREHASHVPDVERIRDAHSRMTKASCAAWDLSSEGHRPYTQSEEEACYICALLAHVAAARQERDHLLVKAEAMHLVIAALSTKMDIADERLVAALDDAEAHVRGEVQTPEGLARVRAAVGLEDAARKGGGS